MNRTNPDEVIPHLPEDRQIALKHFLKRHHRNQWMKNESGWKEAATLVASASGQFNGLNPRRILYCAKHGLLCGDFRQCRRCAVDLRIEPAQAEYGMAFGRASCWYNMVAGVEVDPDRAGLKFVSGVGETGQKNRLQVSKPWIGGQFGRMIPVWPDANSAFQKMGLLIYELCGLIAKCGGGGAFCALEVDVTIKPAIERPSDWWSGLEYGVLPHGNIVINTPFPLTFEAAQAIFDSYTSLFTRHGVRLAYPDLWIKRIKSQEGLNSWLSYSLKAWPTHKWYRRAKVKGCDPNPLNTVFDTVVFDSVVCLVSQVRSPRKFGNLCCNSPNYIGNQLPMRLSKKKIDQWSHDEKFAAEHPDWGDSVARHIEKQAKRRGQRWRNKMNQANPDDGPSIQLSPLDANVEEVNKSVLAQVRAHKGG